MGQWDEMGNTLEEKKLIYEYICKKCGEQQEKMVKMGKGTRESCEKCRAPAKNLKRVLSAHAAMKHSWSKWSV